MTIVAERLAVITLAITSLSSVLHECDGQRFHEIVPLIILLLIMLAISLTLLRWARKQGWR
jgi:hypothetical protein